jgi:DNA-binding CsgD family transcriptional regulator
VTEEGSKVSSLVHKLKHSGIDSSMVLSAKGDMAPGTSVVVVLTPEAAVDAFAKAFEGQGVELIRYALPQLATQARIEMIRIHLALSDLAGARTLMQEVDELLRRRPGLGTLAGEAEELRARLAKERGPGTAGASALTGAELRLLPMLSTHLQMQEIAAEMYLSPHAVRAQGKSLYRKLGAASRGQAVARARELGLLEG